MKFITYDSLPSLPAFIADLTTRIADPGAFITREDIGTGDGARAESVSRWGARAIANMFTTDEASDGSAPARGETYLASLQAHSQTGVSDFRALLDSAKGVTADQLELTLARGHLKEAARAFEGVRAENNQLRNYMRVAGSLLGRADRDPVQLAAKIEAGIIAVNAERTQAMQAITELAAVDAKARRVIAGNTNVEDNGSILDMLNAVLTKLAEERAERSQYAERLQGVINERDSFSDELGRVNNAIACGKTRPGVGIGAIIWKGDKFLMVRRTTEHGQGTWSVPGGWQEHGESFEQAAQRETEEETGVTCQPDHIAGVTNNVFDSEGVHSITVFVHCRHSGGEPVNREAHKHSEVRWVDPRDLPTPLFLPVTLLLRYKPTALLAHGAF